MEKLESRDNENDSNSKKWDSTKDVPFRPTWADELHDQKEARERALNEYRAASESWRSDFNDRATGPVDFDSWVNSEQEGVSKEEIEHDGQKITVYHLTGHDFLFLGHCINYRNKADKIIYPDAYKQSMAIYENPANWVTKSGENNPKSITKDNVKKEGVANNISFSLFSNENTEAGWIDDEKAVYYGVSNIAANKVINSGEGDQHTNRGWTTGISEEGEVRKIETIDEMNSKPGANEVAIDRWGEDSEKTITPDFILCPYGGKLTDAQKKHAAHFGVPIVIIHQDCYGQN